MLERKWIMTNPLLYDVKRTLTSKSVIILMLILILLSFTLVSSFNVSTTVSSNSAITQVYAYYDSSGYHFLAFAWNQFGQGISGVTFQVNVTTSPTYGSQIVNQGQATTNSSGQTQFTILGPVDSNNSLSVSAHQANGFSGFVSVEPFVTYNATTGKEEAVPAGYLVQLEGSSIYSVTDPTNSSRDDLLVNWVGLHGAPPTNYSVYYLFENESSSSSGCTSSGGVETCTTTVQSNPVILNESSMHFLAELNSYTQILSPPNLGNVSSNSTLLINLFYPNGTATDASISFPVFELYPTPPAPISIAQSNSFVIGFFEGIFGIFIPLMAILGSYNSYGKDRISGVLESVLVQPVSRRGLSLSRFFSCFVAMSIAIFIAMGVVDGIVWHFTGSFVSSEIILSSAGAFLVELAAFTGIMMLLSRVVKSSGVLIGIGIGLFIVIDFFWGILLAIVSSLIGVGSSTVAYTKLLIIAEFVNPAQFVGVVDTYLTQQANFVGLGSFGFPITPSQYGITIPSIVLTGVLWAVLPLACFLYLAVKKD
jgi:ABC-2 type transport system permease protein